MFLYACDAVHTLLLFIAEAVLDTAIKMQDTGVLIKVAVKDNKQLVYM